MLQEVRDAVRTGTPRATIEAEAMTELERHGWRPDYITVPPRRSAATKRRGPRTGHSGRRAAGRLVCLDNLELTL